MSKKTTITCDNCNTVQFKPFSKPYWDDTGWRTLRTQWKGNGNDCRRDFCSDNCLEEWIVQANKQFTWSPKIGGSE